MARIRLVQVRKDFGGVSALRGIDLTVEHGELLAILGPSGCGKSTTMQLLAGFLVPDAGEIWAGERLVSSPQGVVPPERRHMSLVFQSYAIWPHMTVFQNVAFGLEMRRLQTRQIEERVRKMLDLVGLGGFEGRYPHELSGGQQQRVALARALVVEPDTLLLDEPLSNLDANLREQMRFEIRRIHERTRVATIYVTHDQSEAMVIADRIAVMNQGVIEQTGTPQEIFDRPRSRFVASFIGGANCLTANVLGSGVVRLGDVQVRTGEQEGFHAGDEVVLCIRPHAVRVHRLRNGVPKGENLARGRLLQQAYLGDFQDLRIALSGGGQVRALTPAGAGYEGDEEVVVELPAHACRLLPT
jgi:iron(III) transport system ATP-binding protein